MDFRACVFVWVEIIVQFTKKNDETEWKWAIFKFDEKSNTSMDVKCVCVRVTKVSLWLIAQDDEIKTWDAMLNETGAQNKLYTY